MSASVPTHDPEPVPDVTPSGNPAEAGNGRGGMRSGAEVVEPASGTGSGSTAGTPWRKVGDGGWGRADGRWSRREGEYALRVERRSGARASWSFAVTRRGVLVALGSSRAGSFDARQKADRAMQAHRDTP